MKIGIDLDGVVIDSEKTFRTYEEIFDILQLEGNNLVDRTEPKYQSRYNWSDEQMDRFSKIYYLKVSQESGLMSGFSSSSLSMDGVSESFSSTQSATSAYFGARIAVYQKEVQDYISANKFKFGFFRVGSL